MTERATKKQIEYLRNLGFKGGAKLSKSQASAKIEELLAIEKTHGVILQCPYCQGELKRRPKRYVTCPHCDEKVFHRRGVLYKAAEWQRIVDQESQTDWLKDAKTDRRDNMREMLRDQREFESEMRRHGGVDPSDEAAGFMVRIGTHCHHAKQMDGLLVLVDDARNDPELLPPYKGCRHDTCECDFDLVTKSEVPRKTRVASQRDRQLIAATHGESPFATASPFAPSQAVIQDLPKRAKSHRMGCLARIGLFVGVLVAAIVAMIVGLIAYFAFLD